MMKLRRLHAGWWLVILLVVATVAYGSHIVGVRAGYDDDGAGGRTLAATPALQRLTSGGCCTQPSWTPDSQRVLFIDKPAANQPLGIWGVGVGGGAAELFTQRIAFYSPGMTYIVEVTQGKTTIERRADGARWTVPANGRNVTFSPAGTKIVWTVSNQDVPSDQRMTEVWVANVDGTNSRKVATVRSGGISGWVSEDALLMRGRVNPQGNEDRIYTLSLANGSTVDVAQTKRLQSLTLSPDGRWVAYYVAFSDVAEQNGFWVARTDGSVKRQLDPALFGSFRWRDGGRLLLIPMRPNAAYHELWEYNADSNTSRQLTSAGNMPLKVANSDWTVSPNGQHVAFVESRDHNIWVLTLRD